MRSCREFQAKENFLTLTQPISEEQVKPFRLVKYFTFTSLIVIFAGSLVLSLLNTHYARSMQQKRSEEYAHLLIENLNHQVFLQFILPTVLKYGKIKLSDSIQFERMDKVVRSTLHSFKVDLVNIYDMENTISYSFDPELVGKINVGGRAYQDAVEGKLTSKLIQRGSWFEIYLGFPRNSKLVTFAPLRAERPLSSLSGPVLGVVEIVQDLSGDYQAIFDFQTRVIATLSVVMGGLFLVLLLVVKRGEGIIEQRALERLRLKEQLSRAERLSSLGEMVAAISHEIRNPLGIIRSSAELLKKRMDATDAANAFPGIIIEESNRLNDIITDFLNYAKPRLPDLEMCSLEDILEKNITFLAPQMAEGNHTVARHYGHDLPDIWADADMLYQAFLNILINAMQAMPRGGKIDVETFADPNSVTIHFDDEGQGVAEEIVQKIWDPFFTTKDKGTGLGLGIVKNIVEAHGGSVRITNRDGGGTRVTVVIPVRQGA